MSFFSRKKYHLSPPQSPSADGLASQSTQQPGPVCTWSAHAPQPRAGPWPFPRSDHTLTATGTAAGEFFLFGGWVHDRARSDLYIFSARDLSTTLLQTSGEAPTPRRAHRTALIGATLLFSGGKPDFGRRNVPNDDSLYLLNLGTSNHLMSSPTPADRSFALQNRESGPALWSMVLDPTLVAIIPQPWSVPSSSSSVVGSAGIFSMICGHSISVVRLPIAAPIHFDPIYLQ
jgi:hypothetical protein